MDYVQIARDIISIDTTAPPGRNYDRIMDYLGPRFKEVGFEPEIVHITREYSDGNEPRVNLLAHRRQPGQPRLIFYGHADVVPAEGWDAFAPKVEDGKIYGRGAADMKCGIVALLLGLDRVRDRPLRYDVSVMITTDEEVGQPNQLRYLRRYLQPVLGSYVFNLDSSFGYVATTGLGALGMVVRVVGKSVHSAMAHLGENAVEKAVPLMQALLELKKKVVQRRSSVDAHPATGLTKMEARLNLNMVNGGLKANIVPDECLIAIDRRLVPEEKMDEARRELLDTLGSVPDVRWEVQQEFAIPTVPPIQDPIVDELAGLIQRVAGETGKYGEMGSGDLPYIVTEEWGGKEFGLGVIRPECNIHGKEEFAYLKDIESLGEIVARFVAA